MAASGKLDAICEEKGVQDADGRRALLEDHDDARYYDGKIHSARYFLSQRLPRVRSIADAILSGCRSPLDIVF
jgi:hypothetical protein